MDDDKIMPPIYAQYSTLVCIRYSQELGDACPGWIDGTSKIPPSSEPYCVVKNVGDCARKEDWMCEIKCVPFEFRYAMQCQKCFGKFPLTEKRMLEEFLRLHLPTEEAKQE